jgi:hypothetical protein
VDARDDCEQSSHLLVYIAQSKFASLLQSPLTISV